MAVQYTVDSMLEAVDFGMGPAMSMVLLLSQPMPRLALLRLQLSVQALLYHLFLQPQTTVSPELGLQP